MSCADMITQASVRNCLHWAASHTQNLQTHLTPRLSFLFRGSLQRCRCVTTTSKGSDPLLGWGSETSRVDFAGSQNLRLPQLSHPWKTVGSRGHENLASATFSNPLKCQGSNQSFGADPKESTNSKEDSDPMNSAHFEGRQNSNGAESRTESFESASTSSRSGADCAHPNEEDGLRVAVGSIHIIMGPMFAGKTTALLSRMQEAVAQGKKVALVKSGIDVRYGLSDIVSHDGTRMPCLAVDTLADFQASIGDRDYDGLDVIGIDEAQFFTDLDAFCRRAADRDHKEVIIAGLDGDFKRRKFGQLLDLVPTADSIVKLSATCELCRQPAFFTLRKTEETETQVVGGADKYMPVCRAHWVEGNYAIKVARTFLRGSERVSESREPSPASR